MKGKLEADGTTRLLSAADEWSAVAYSSRILDNMMAAWLHLVQRVAERSMAPPYNVRYFQVWNELKGYYNPITNAYDYADSPGDPSGANATHGYTYMYNQVYRRLMAVAGKLGIPQASISIGGPYVVMDTWSSANQSTRSSLSKAYGTFDQRPLDVVQYWLQHKAGAGFITVDANNSNRDGVNLSDPFTAAEKFGDITHWIRSLDPRLYPGAATLPVWLAEWYASPYAGQPDARYDNAVKAVAMIGFIKAGGAVALSWGGVAADGVNPNLWTDTRRGGGQALPWYYTYKALKDDFAPGTPLYATSVTMPASVDALASAHTVMLVNKTPASLSLQINGKLVTLGPYEVRFLNYA
jgi:hypothetical protein